MKEVWVSLPNGQRIGMLPYGDDIVLLAPSVGQLRNLCKIVEGWLDKYCVDINIEKSEIVIYNGSQTPVISIKGKI